MNLSLSTVPYGHVHEVLPLIVHYAKKGAEWTLGRMGTDDVVRSMIDPENLLWIVFDENNTVHGYLTTKIIDYPSGQREFTVLTCGGHEGKLAECVDLVFDTFETYAKQSGCTGLAIIGRPAWWAFIKDRGYEQPQRQYFKRIEHEED